MNRSRRSKNYTSPIYSAIARLLAYSVFSIPYFSSLPHRAVVQLYPFRSFCTFYLSRVISLCYFSRIVHGTPVQVPLLFCGDNFYERMPYLQEFASTFEKALDNAFCSQHNWLGFLRCNTSCTLHKIQYRAVYKIGQRTVISDNLCTFS